MRITAEQPIVVAGYIYKSGRDGILIFAVNIYFFKLGDEWEERKFKCQKKQLL